LLDGLRFEERGIPAAVIVTEPFRATVALMAELHELPGYPVVTIPHPVTSLTPTQVRELAAAAAPEVERLLLELPGGASGKREAGAAELSELVEELAAALRSDGADLEGALSGARTVTFRLQIRDEACAECILPGRLLQQIFDRKVRERLGDGYDVVLIDPRAGGRSGS
jgi:hypothetical protein